ncbi:hypothetical protein PS710_01163 [Pseudomonas fluorescens]|uniref:Uncharacterized protein n=1 Tax=Pseudomonas fluorescens TaxID=294 RepID=A0A5E7APS8_PSEFL|nr:hypothetical protein PS710_01163 [Pseudomonas fluorescens]
MSQVEASDSNPPRPIAVAGRRIAEHFNLNGILEQATRHKASSWHTAR